MSDRETLAAYNAKPGEFTKDWLSQPTPADLQETVRRFFKHGGVTADIGAGSGREVAWLNQNGYPAVGYDTSPGLLAEARRLYPQYRFETAALPLLAGIADNSFDNVVCETVIMHLPLAEIFLSVRKLEAILKPGGTLYLSWRVTRDKDQRDPHGRLYTAFDKQIVRDQLTNSAIVYDAESISASSRKLIHTFVARKSESA